MIQRTLFLFPKTFVYKKITCVKTPRKRVWHRFSLLRYISWYARIIVTHAPSHNILNIQTIAFFFQHFQICLIGFIVSGFSENIVLLINAKIKWATQGKRNRKLHVTDYARLHGVFLSVYTIYTESGIFRTISDIFLLYRSAFIPRILADSISESPEE